MPSFVRVSDLILEYKQKPPMPLKKMVTCTNCGVNLVSEEGEWCWVCIRDRESLD